jgi:hypothetical protein
MGPSRTEQQTVVGRKVQYLGPVQSHQPRGNHDNRLHPFSVCRHQSGGKVVAPSHFERLNLDTQRAPGSLRRRELVIRMSGFQRTATRVTPGAASLRNRRRLSTRRDRGERIGIAFRGAEEK